jgi:predicted transcriptional regulator
MRARDLVGQVPLVEMDLPVVEAARMLADRCLPGLVVVDDHCHPVAVLPGVEVLRLLVPHYIQISPVIARVIDERHADAILTEAENRTVRQCLPAQRAELPVVSADASVVEIATLMTDMRCPLAVVVEEPATLLGVVTLDALLKRMFAS